MNVWHHCCRVLTYSLTTYYFPNEKRMRFSFCLIESSKTHHSCTIDLLYIMHYLNIIIYKRVMWKYEMLYGVNGGGRERYKWVFNSVFIRTPSPYKNKQINKYTSYKNDILIVIILLYYDYRVSASSRYCTQTKNY